MTEVEIDIDLFIDEAKKVLSDEHATADQMDILVSKTRELTATKMQQVEALKALLEAIESKVGS